MARDYERHSAIADNKRGFLRVLHSSSWLNSHRMRCLIALVAREASIGVRSIALDYQTTA